MQPIVLSFILSTTNFNPMSFESSYPFKIFYLLLFFLSGQAGFSQSQVRLDPSKESQWKQDIDFLQSEILRRHPDPFYKNADLDRNKFDQLFNDLRAHLSDWNENKIITELTRIVGMMNDGHSSIDVFAGAPTFYEFKFFPLMLYYFPEGLYVVGASKAHENLIGTKITAINKMPIEEVMNRLKPLISKDYGNEASFKDAIRNLTIVAQYLNGTGIITDPSEATYSFEDKNGKIINIKFSIGTQRDLFSAFDMSGNEGKPLYRHDPRKAYWFRFLESENALYIKHTFQIVDQQYKPDVFCAEMQAVLDSKNPTKIILDLRQGQGGNIGTLKPIYDFLTQSNINQYGKLYVLMDRRSQSAGTVLALRLSMISNAILIGEPAVSAVNFFDNDIKFSLPNSKLKIGVSTHFLNAGLPVDSRIQFPPEILKEITAKDYFSLKDPVLDFALAHKALPRKLIQAEIRGGAAGLYQYSPLQILEVKKVNSEWKMIVEDGNQVDFLNTHLYSGVGGNFQTDISWLTISFTNQTLNLHTPWGDMNLKQLPADYLPPQKLLALGKIDEAVSEIKNIFGQVKKMELRDFEANINRWGYQFVAKKELHEAFTLFKLNSDLFPQSANVWDSLGEVYALLGDKAEATRCYQKALEITPGLINAMRALEKLK